MSGQKMIQMVWQKGGSKTNQTVDKGRDREGYG